MKLYCVGFQINKRSFSLSYLLCYVFEDPGIALVPKFPRGEEGDGSQISALCHDAPPRKDSVRRPCLGIDEVEPEPIVDEPPIGESTMNEEVVHRLQDLLAKRANATIRPTPLIKPVGGPKPILDGKPCKELDFWRGPNLPNGRAHGRGGGAKKLGFVSGVG
jgi:hypothetical protein